MKINIEEWKKGLEDVRDHIAENMKKEVDGVKEYTAEEIKKVTDGLDEKIANQVKELKKRKLSLPGLEEEKKKFHFGNVVLAQLSRRGFDDVPDSDYEKEVCEQTAKLYQSRSNNASSGAAGAYLIPEEETGKVIDLAMANTPVMQLGPTVLNGLRGELPIPKVTGRPTMYWVGEEEAPTESATAFGEIVLRKKTAAGFTKVSQDLLYQSKGVADKIIRQQIVNSFKLGLNQAYIQGLGSEKSIKGIKNYGGLTSTDALGTNGNRFRIDKAAEMQMNIDVADMLNGNLGYLMRPEVKSYLLRERVLQYSGQAENSAMPINANSILMSQAELEATLGYKVKTTTLISKTTKGTSTLDASTVIFGDWAQLVIGMWEGFELKASDVAGNSGGSAHTQRQVWIVAFQGIDSNILDETGFTKIDDALCTASNFS